jgi:small acid-soluble spore protein E (minor gamma-type SASP)
MTQFNKQAGKTSAGTNIQEVRQQNAQSAQAGAGQFGTEFGAEFGSATNAQKVAQQNQKAEAKKNQNS